MCVGARRVAGPVAAASSAQLTPPPPPQGALGSPPQPLQGALPLRAPRLPRAVVASARVDLGALWGRLQPLVACRVSWAPVEADGDDDNAANENRVNEQRERERRAATAAARAV